MLWLFLVGLEINRKGSFKESQLERAILGLGALRQEVVQKGRGLRALPSHRMSMVAVVTSWTAKACSGQSRLCFFQLADFFFFF